MATQSNEQPICCVPYSEWDAFCACFENDPQEFQRPWDYQEVFPDGGAAIVDRSVVSQHFGLCAPVILKNVDTGLVGLLHVKGLRISARQNEIIQAIGGQTAGGVRAIILEGGVSFPTNNIQLQLEARGVQVDRVISVPTGSAHFAVALRPGEDTILVQNKVARELQVFQGFGV